jgi:uncharacterized protein with ATP-grasp and redox domains
VSGLKRLKERHVDMRTSPDCIPCLIRLATETVKRATNNNDIINTVIERTVALTKTMDMDLPPPKMGQLIHRIVIEETGNTDPYLQIKKQCNEIALKIQPELREIIKKSSDRFLTAAKLAIAGNIIDFATPSEFSAEIMSDTINEALSSPVDPASFKLLKKNIEKANKILYLGDNAGEIIFDKIFIDELPKNKITFCVRGLPILNDALMDDAGKAGLTSMVKVIDSGTDLPGIIPDECSTEFKNCFNEADLIIAKGQGNFETLNDSKRNIFFLFKVKCPVVAIESKSKIGDTIIINSKACQLQ